MWASVQTLRGCPKHCSFCSVWRTDGQKPRQRSSDAVIEELVELRRLGFRFIVLADDNFYPVTLDDLAAADRRADKTRHAALSALRQERFELMAQMAKLPDDMVFYTQITMEAAEDPEFLAAMRGARIRGALVGVESVTPEGLKAVFKNFNMAGEGLVTRLQAFRAAPQDFDAILTDMAMPNMNGLQFADAVREERGDIPIAIASGNAADVGASRVEIDAVIQKPVDMVGLARLLDGLFVRVA
jgi:radical SAM superfamily enzyme YgiQ (UPF0313 family)